MNYKTADIVGSARKFPDDFKERFSFVLYNNDEIICQRYFKMNRFVEGSMSTIDFKLTVDDIVTMIKNALAEQSRIYMYYNSNYSRPYNGRLCNERDFGEDRWNADIADDTLNQPLQEEWKQTLKFVIFDGTREVISKIFDASVYPFAIRNNICITKSKDKDENYSDEKYVSKLWGASYIQMIMYNNTPDLVNQIVNKIYEVCTSKREENGEVVVPSLSSTYMGYNLNRTDGYTKKPYSRK